MIDLQTAAVAVPILLILVYVIVRVGSAAFFRSKRDYIRRLLHGNGTQDEHPEQ